jgi:hypothetical protein
MNRVLNFALKSLCLLLLCCPLESFVRRKSTFAVSDQIRALDYEASRCLKKENRWGYYILKKPDMFDSGLTYWIEAIVCLNKRIESFEEAERLYVDIYKDFFRDVHSLRCIRPFLATFPLTLSSCDLTVGFEDEKGKTLRPPYIASIFMKNDQLHFFHCIDLPGAGRSEYEAVLKKPVQDIVGLKELYSPSVERRSLGEKQEIPPFSGLCWKDDTPAGKCELGFAQKFCKENDLEIVTFGCVGKDYFDIRDFNFVFCGKKNLNLDQAKKLAKQCFHDFFDFEQRDRDCLEFIKLKRATRPRVVPLTGQLGLRISFWDDYLDRVVSPNIAEIRYLDGKFTFYTADEHQVLKLVHEETIQETHYDTDEMKN